MFRSRGENLHSVFVLLFLNVAFFLLEHQDPQKYARLFGFNWPAVRAGEPWRLFTYQFTQAGQGWMETLALFITLIFLYILGSAIEEEWGTSHFAMLFLVSTLASAGVAAWIGIPLLGTYFVYFTLLFVYASAFPEQSFYLFGMIPIRVRLLAAFALAVLIYGAFAGGAANVAALAGAVAGYAYYLSQRIRVHIVRTAAAPAPAQAAAEAPRVRIDTTAIHNAARYAAIKQALTRQSQPDADRLIALCEREKAAGVNICPPADYKPDHVDGYCIRCEGFAECSARYLMANRPPDPAPAALPMPDSP